MKAILLNVLLGLGLGRLGTIWQAIIFIPVVALEIAYSAYFYGLSLDGGLRRADALMICAQLAFMLGALLRPLGRKN